MSCLRWDSNLRRLFRATNSDLLQNYKPPATHRSIELWAFPFNARFNYSAAPRVLKLYRTVYSLKTRCRSFHTFMRPVVFERRYRLYGVYFQLYGKVFLMHTVRVQWLVADPYCISLCITPFLSHTHSSSAEKSYCSKCCQWQV